MVFLARAYNDRFREYNLFVHLENSHADKEFFELKLFVLNFSELKALFR